jgi:predicted amidohydrolase YtcJ
MKTQVRAHGGHPGAAGPAGAERLRSHINPDAIDAYTIAGARFLFADKDAGSLEVGKSGDFIVLDRDILALADAARFAQAANTKVLSTHFMGSRVYQSNP